MKKIISLTVLLLIAAVIFALLSGNGAISTADVVRVLLGGGTASQKMIVYQVRIPRIAAALGAGAALSVSGFLLQECLDNRIASPGILGINNGAGLFVLISALLFPFQTGMKCLMAFLGASLVTLLVTLLSERTGMSKTSVILSGVAVSALCVSAIDLIISLKPETVADKAAFQIGGFASVQPVTVRFALPFIAAGIIIALINAPGMDILALGDETAHGLGLNVKKCRGVCILCASVLAGAAISMAGLISFVGLIVPNCVRGAHIQTCREGLMLCTISGGAFLLLCDTAARLIAFPYELPCGMLLSIIGAPFLIALLIRKRKHMGTD